MAGMSGSCNWDDDDDDDDIFITLFFKYIGAWIQGFREMLLHPTSRLHPTHILTYT